MIRLLENSQGYAIKQGWLLTAYKSHSTFAYASTLKEALRHRSFLKSSRVLMDMARVGSTGDVAR